MKNFDYLLQFVPISVWIDTEKLHTIFNKLLQCNDRLINHSIENNTTKNIKRIAYQDLEETVVHNLLDRCINAATPEEAVKFLASQPRQVAVELSEEEIQHVKQARVEKEMKSNLSRVARSIGSSLGHSIGPESSSQKEIGPQSAEVNFSQSYLKNDTLLLGTYGISMLLKSLGLKNRSLANAQPALNGSAIDFKAKKINHAAEQLRAAEKQYEGINNSSFQLSSRN
ncbi:hypothetical protein [Rickettsiella endosymbiont of Dermanyssus gallinae]|uniref:hypothetical protein n=1 Tax=Rickettsiella endosymbiont of Dermanyssus gallinae TaxID=2856608 RepID=UPI001C52E8D4|nr:hypothetical protein [Rickettsiella endosymbiont of Dermanyssus gallinae]